MLPHPGGGGDTYVNALSAMEGYTFERFYLAPSPDPAGVGLTIARRAMRANRKAFSHDIVHVAGEVASLLSLPALASRPSVVTTHGLHLLRRVEGVRKAAARQALRAVVTAASRTVCTSESERAELLQIVRGHVRQRAVVVPNGVSVGRPLTTTERTAARNSFGLNEQDVVAVWLGSLEEHKDPLTAIRAVSRARATGTRIVLLVAGDGPMRRNVEALAREDEFGAIRVLGFRRDVGQLLTAADVFLLSSLREGLSFALLEAMALGLPAVATNTPANAEALGSAGILVPYGSAEGFADALRRIAADDQHRRVLGEGARVRIERRFSLEEMIRQTRDVYDEVLLADRAQKRRRV